MSKLKAFADDNLYVAQIMDFVFYREDSIVGKGEKCWLPAVFPFPTMFLNGLYLRVVKSLDFVVKDEPLQKVGSLSWTYIYSKIRQPVCL